MSSGFEEEASGSRRDFEDAEERSTSSILVENFEFVFEFGLNLLICSFYDDDVVS